MSTKRRCRYDIGRPVFLPVAVRPAPLDTPTLKRNAAGVFTTTALPVDCLAPGVWSRLSLFHHETPPLVSCTPARPVRLSALGLLRREQAGENARAGGAVLHKAIELEPNQIAADSLLAETYRERKDDPTTAARTALRLAVAGAGTNPGKDEASRELAALEKRLPAKAP